MKWRKESFLYEQKTRIWEAGLRLQGIHLCLSQELTSEAAEALDYLPLSYFARKAVRVTWAYHIMSCHVIVCHIFPSCLILCSSSVMDFRRQLAGWRSMIWTSVWDSRHPRHVLWNCVSCVALPCNTCLPPGRTSGGYNWNLFSLSYVVSLWKGILNFHEIPSLTLILSACARQEQLATTTSQLHEAWKWQV